MKLLKTLFALGFSLASCVGAVAADYSDYSVDYAAPESTPMNWEGFYAGVGVGGGASFKDAVTGKTGFVDLVVGANGVTDNILYGIEVTVGGYFGATGAYGPGFGMEGRVGYLVVPEAVVYASVGGYAFRPGALYGHVGAGVEFAVAEQVSLDLEYKYGGISNNGFRAHSVGAQALWHF